MPVKRTKEAAPQHSDVKARLRDIINDHSTAKVKAGKDQHSGDSYVDHDGDGTEGNVTYYCKGDLRQAPYELGSTKAGNIAGSIDFDSSKNVVPVTNYVPEAEDHENYTAMESMRPYREAIERWALLKAELYTELPEYHERYISQKTRDNMDSSDFAGKGTSFPIKSQADVSAALHSIGRAGAGNYSGDTLRANIKKIAKRKGFALPDSLKDASDKEAFRTRGTSAAFSADETSSGDRRESVSHQASRSLHDFTTDYPVEKRGTLRSTWKPQGALLLESSAAFCEQPRLTEAATTDYPIKLISPGRGSSGFYPPETLKRAAENKVFKAGTHMFWNHDTDAEEAARPEGDLNRLAAVTTTDAKWDEAGHDGPGLYARAKVFSDYADKVKEMGPHIGLSIRAGGDRDESAKAPDGKPRVITALRNAASVDFVTKAGRDGKIFTESESSEGEDMDKNEVLALIKEANAPLIAENKQLREMLATVKAKPLITERLAAVRLPEAIKSKIVEALAPAIPTDANGQVDLKKLDEAIDAKAKEWIELLPALGVEVNPAALGKRMTEAEVLKDIENLDTERGNVLEGLAELFVGPKFAKGSVSDEKRRARKLARESFLEGKVA
jgi:hypothetical protein